MKNEFLKEREAEVAAKLLQGSNPNIQALPLRGYLEETVVPLVIEGLSAVARERPANPVEYLATFLLKHNPQK